MRYLWVDEGNDPNYVKGDQYAINGYFFAMFDPRLNKAYIDAVANKGYAVGVYMALNWPQFQGLDGPAAANVVDARVSQIMGGPANVRPSRPKVQFDMESEEWDRIASCLERYRQLRPNQDVSWTMEGHKGGAMPLAFVQRIKAVRVRLVPQCYNGAMTQVWDTLAMARDLTKVGFPDNLISPFYDAARLPEWWDGYAFTQGRLP